MTMNECDKINSYNALVSANHKESFIAAEKPKTIANSVDEHVQKSKAEKEANRVISSGYSTSPAINTKLAATSSKSSSSTSTYSSGGSGYYNNSGYTGYGSSSGYSQSNGYKGNNLDYNTRISKIRQKAKETAERQKKYEQSRGAGLIDFEGKYSFSIERGKVKHHTKRNNKVTKLFSKNMTKQLVVAAGVIVLEAALGLAISEAKSNINSISNEIKKSFTSKAK